MKTIYQLKPNENRKNRLADVRNRFVLPIGILVITILISSSSLGQSVVGLFYSVIKVGNQLYENVPFVPKFVSDRSDLVKENKNLFEEIERLRLELADYETVAEENGRLYAELGLRPKTDFIGAKIVAKSPQVTLDTILIDKGDADGIKKSNIVLASDRVMIGKVAEVSNNDSIVALSSISSSVLYGYVERTGEPLSVEGIGGGGMRSRVPIDFDINETDKIVFEGSQIFLAGTVASMEEDRAVGFKEVFLSLPASVAKIRFVFVEPDQKSPN